LNKDEIHFFNDIAYYHVPFTHCPTSEKIRLDNKCHCNPKDNFDWKGYSCKPAPSPNLTSLRLLLTAIGTSRFFEINGMEKPAGYENQQD
jgi:alpha 1,2-mannosyltransferase